MPIGAHILTAADDPVIPLADFHALQLPPQVTLDVATHGGHCGFLDGWHLRGFRRGVRRAPSAAGLFVTASGENRSVSPQQLD
jgi:hypothetical protein